MTDLTRRIATLILPLRDNAGRKLTLQHANLRVALLNDFGGYTQTLVTGAWKGDGGKVYQDDSLKYEIAMTTGMSDGQKLVTIATLACRDAGQECVMIQLASGVVHFIDQKGSMR
jgi:hypothetical protein